MLSCNHKVRDRIREEVKMKHLSLQLFADGAGAGAAAAGTATGAETGSTGQPATGNNNNAEGAAGSTTGAENTAEQSQVETFDDLIKGRYKQDFDAKVQSIINKRFKGAREAEASMNKLSQGISALGTYYGLDAESPDFLDSLNSKIMDDEKLYEKEASERGMNVEDVKRIRRMEQENRALKMQNMREKEERQREEFYRGVINQVPEVQKIYPQFDVDAEMANEQFFNLVRNGVGLRNAYEVIHSSELQAARDAIIAQKAQEQLSNSVRANGMRPNEVEHSNASDFGGRDIKSMTRSEIKQIIRRAERGEVVKFT